MVLYLSLITANSKSFGTHRPTLREAFPKLFRHEKRSEAPKSDTLHELHHDEPAVYHDEKAIWRTLLLGIPDWKEWEFSYTAIAVNILLTLLSLDMIFRGPLLYDGKDLTFTRLGYVDDTSAKVLLRDPNITNLPIYVYLRPSNSPAWSNVDTLYYLGEDSDYTYPITFSKLQPDTAYTYALSNDLKGHFQTAPGASDQNAKSLIFLTSSCIKANFPYNPFSHSLSIHGFKHLSNVMKALPSRAAFMLFLGDFIYVDVPQRLSSTVEHYRSEYRRAYKSPSWQLPGLQIPWLHTLDDHEIANDWAGGNETEPFPAASDPFLHYHVSVNPPFPEDVPASSRANTTYFQFTQGPASFFMLDTRRYRTQPESEQASLFFSAKLLYGSSSAPSQAPEYAPSMLGPAQLQSLLSYLTTPEPPNVHWKFVASSVPFTKNWKVGTSDTWGGFLTERQRVLDAMHFAEANLGVRVVILSGDRHEFAAVRFPPSATRALSSSKDGATGPHEFSVGPLSMFYLPLRTFKQTDDEDVAIAYYPDGNSKVGTVEIASIINRTCRNSRSILTYTLWVDGSRRWNYTIESPSSVIVSRSNLDTWRS
ncbi:hypothetical protein LTR05_002536 [Lithohypha guttulata]|uniref:PhoD-like phosphatase metallophosphatase domain-containing protein n=1 Tax=Lithohypha guttulata TaxID=1690604 RepID=A0AAN7YJ18_9EURO|nr:hypothetical protein LTR05_002536 [Lithohypha guttulata]